MSNQLMNLLKYKPLLAMLGLLVSTAGLSVDFNASCPILAGRAWSEIVNLDAEELRRGSHLHLKPECGENRRGVSLLVKQEVIEIDDEEVDVYKVLVKSHADDSITTVYLDMSGEEIDPYGDEHELSLRPAKEGSRFLLRDRRYSSVEVPNGQVSLINATGMRIEIIFEDEGIAKSYQGGRRIDLEPGSRFTVRALGIETPFELSAAAAGKTLSITFWRAKY